MANLDEHVSRALGPDYRVERELGGGGMSRVFLAREVALDRLVVVKVHPFESQGLGGDRFRREIQVAAQLQHPNLVPVLSAGESEGLLFFVMPYVEGESLRALLDREGPMAPSRARIVLRDIARALAFAHGNGIVHRDIKPDNVLMAGDAAMVTDFGVAKALSSAREAGPALTGVGMSLGTPSYIAPEQAAGGDRLDHRADLYAWGCVAYEVLTGAPPFVGKNAQQLIVAHIVESPPPLGPRCPDAPARLVGLIMQCLEKDPDRRPASGQELVDALERVDDPPASSGRKWWPAAIAVFVLLVAAGWWAIRSGRPVVVGGRISAVAVLPLVSGAGGDEYFADGMTEELITALGRISGLRVASRTSVYAIKRTDGLDVRQIARRLNVGAILEGSIRRAGGQLRLNAQLTSAADGLTLWSETYQRPDADLFQMQDELARAIAGVMKVRLDGSTAPPRGTKDLAAYDLYLRARHRWRQRDEPALREAIGLFQRALAIDSTFARAWAGLGDALSLLPLYGAVSVDSILGPARAAAERAARLDPALAAAHATLGNLAKSTGDWAAATQALDRAIQLDSVEANALQWRGEVGYLTGRLPAAIAAFERAARADSTSPIILGQLGHTLGLAGRPLEALAAANRALVLAPDLGAVHFFAGSVHFSAGRFAEAASAFERAGQLSPSFGAKVGLVCYALTRAGSPNAARACAAFVEPGASPTSVALIGLARGDRGAAITTLERGFAQRDPFLLASSLTAPWWSDLRGDPRFSALASQLGVELPGPRP